MHKTRSSASLKLLYIISSIFLIASIVIFAALGFFIQYQNLTETYALAEETTSYLKSECQKYDNYMQGNSARSKQDLLDTATGLNKFVSDENLTDSDFLHTFIHEEHVSGIIVLDRNLSPLAQSDMDDQDAYALWENTILQSNIRDILQHPEKTYIDHTCLKKIPYDYAVISSNDGSRLILCYSSTEKPASDPYELTLKNILTNSSFHKNPTLVISNGTQILSTNNPLAEELGREQYQQLSSSIQWEEGQLTKFKYQNTTWYGLRLIYGNYTLYAVYPSDEIFSNRTNFIVFALMAYLGFCVIFLAVQKHFDKLSMRKMEKQLHIINAISTSYSSTFLLHIDTMELEPIKPSDRLKTIFADHPNPYDFLFTVCKNEVTEDDYPAIMHFLDLDTIAERLKGTQFLGTEVKDPNGLWYSVLLIPQTHDSEGNIQSLLITTRDVTSMKQAEELSFKDKLTGLHNRNYMESRNSNFVRSGDFPVSLIMADCNYLKQTNDTLGHEYGDLLLQRVANIFQETIPQNSLAMRIGGDEFLILCPQCDKDAAFQLITTIKQKLVEKSDEKLTLSVSFGVSTTETEPFVFEQAYETADHEMYRDKQTYHSRRND